MTETQLIEDNLRELADNIDDWIEQTAGKRLAFNVVIYTGLRPQYIGNCSREDAVKALRELLTYWESGALDIKPSEVQ